MPRVIHFEIHAEQPDRAIRFYTDLFGWTFTHWAGPVDYWVIRTGEPGEPGIDGGLLRRHGPINGDSVIAHVCTVDVPSLADAMERARAGGGTLALDRMAIPGVGWLAYMKDPEGNIFGMMESDPAAA
jgi:uncharacterized protein